MNMKATENLLITNTGCAVLTTPISVQVKLNHVISEMQNPKNYYSQPNRDKLVCVVMPGKQEEWISRLLMIKNELEEVVGAEDKDCA